ncbi:MAG TPA: sugar ABC transporter permease [Acholeplasmataceae bacterium]|nr:sugar ABC transporter permease [Acholeplasmataceae bacterium]
MLLFLIVFLIYPFGVNVYNSFFKYKIVLDRNPIYIGLGNYQELILRRQFKGAIKNTFVLMFFVVLFQVGFALILALLVS